MIDEIKEGEEIKPDVEDIFIDENNLFDFDDISTEDKKFILDLVDWTNFNDHENLFFEGEDAPMEVFDKTSTAEKNIEEEQAIIENEKK